MEKIKIIDLLNRVHNGDIPSKIEYFGDIYEYNGNNYECFKIDHYDSLMDNLCYLDDLTDEVEIIEENKKINKIQLMGLPSQEYHYTDLKNYKVKDILEEIRERLFENEHIMIGYENKINEIIDYINKENK